MLKADNFKMEHINALRKESNCDPAILERTVYAFGLLESLVRVNMPFIFKGGTCLMLLLKSPRRLSTDIDIIVEPGIDISCQACSVMYMAACILKNKEFVRIEKPEDYLKDSISKSKYKNLAYIKKLKLEAYGYLVEAVRLLEERE